MSAVARVEPKAEPGVATPDGRSGNLSSPPLPRCPRFRCTPPGLRRPASQFAVRYSLASASLHERVPLALPLRDGKPSARTKCFRVIRSVASNHPTPRAAQHPSPARSTRARPRSRAPAECRSRGDRHGGGARSRRAPEPPRDRRRGGTSAGRWHSRAPAARRRRVRRNVPGSR